MSGSASNGAPRKRRRRTLPATLLAAPSEAALLAVLLMMRRNAVADAFVTPQRHQERSLGLPPSAFRFARNNEWYTTASRRLASISTDPGNLSFSDPYPETPNTSMMRNIASARRIIQQRLQQRDDRGALDELSQIVSIVQRRLSYEESERLAGLIQCYLTIVLVRDAPLAYQALEMFGKLSKHIVRPFSLVPRRTLLDLLKALTSTSAAGKNSRQPISRADAAYRVFQRLLTGNQVQAPREPSALYEADWNRVLGAFCREARMERAHRLIALQERHRTPALSAVTFSILLKAHGRLKEYQQVLRVWNDAHQHGIVPDIVMVNTLLNACIDCNELSAARTIFEEAKSRHSGSYFHEKPPAPNARTYNTMLKGLARAQGFDEATALAQEAQSLGLWDFVTTNTLVQAAIAVGRYDAADSILQTHTLPPSDGRRRHPNVEAYTDLINAYAKSSRMDEAMATLNVMQARDVAPTEVTYTCLIAGFGRTDKLEKALEMIEFMSSNGMQPGCVVYNALISSLVEPLSDESRNNAMDAGVDKAMRVLQIMAQSGVRPNAVTLSTLVAAMGRCSPPRAEAAKLLVQRFVDQGILPQGNAKVVSALIQTCGMGQDLSGALAAFKTLDEPDAIAVNAFLDACCRCGKNQIAFDTFHHYFRRQGLRADVQSYTVLVTAVLKREAAGALGRVAALYQDMVRADVAADTTLVDIVLKAVVRAGRSRRLSATELDFLGKVLRDAEALPWVDDQLQRRKRAVHGVLDDRQRDLLRRDAELNRILSSEDNSDELFRRKGWNQVDSGFRVWGAFKGNDKNGSVDEFLKAKGWNDVDSGFRFL